MKKFKVKQDWNDFTYLLTQEEDGDYIVSWTEGDEYQEVDYSKEQVEKSFNGGFWTIVE